MKTFLTLFKETKIEYEEHCEYWNGQPNCTLYELFYFRLEEVLGLVS